MRAIGSMPLVGAESASHERGAMSRHYQEGNQMQPIHEAWSVLLGAPMTITNEAAERLHNRIDGWNVSNDVKREEHHRLDEALAALISGSARHSRLDAAAQSTSSMSG